MCNFYFVQEKNLLKMKSPSGKGLVLVSTVLWIQQPTQRRILKVIFAVHINTSFNADACW